MNIVLYVMSGLGILLMAYAVFSCIRLYRLAPGGKAKGSLGILLVLVVVFLFGYIAGAVLLFNMETNFVKDAIVFGIFDLGAVFVIVALGLIRRILAYFEGRKA
jgi:hypothetical protein